MNRLAGYESWGNAVTSCNYMPYKRVTWEKERSRTGLPCGRSVCSRCQANCVANPH